MSQFANANAKTSCALLHFHPEEEAAWHSAFLYIGLNGKLHSAVFVDCCVYFTTLISHIFADNFTIAHKEQFKIQPFLIPSTPSGIDNAADNAKEQSPMQDGGKQQPTRFDCTPKCSRQHRQLEGAEAVRPKAMYVFAPLKCRLKHIDSMLFAVKPESGEH